MFTKTGPLFILAKSHSSDLSFNLFSNGFLVLSEKDLFLAMEAHYSNHKVFKNQWSSSTASSLCMTYFARVCRLFLARTLVPFDVYVGDQEVSTFDWWDLAFFEDVETMSMYSTAMKIDGHLAKTKVVGQILDSEDLKALLAFKGFQKRGSGNYELWFRSAISGFLSFCDQCLEVHSVDGCLSVTMRTMGVVFTMTNLSFSYISSILDDIGFCRDDSNIKSSITNSIAFLN